MMPLERLLPIHDQLHQLHLSAAVQVVMPSGPFGAIEKLGPPHLYPKGLLIHDLLHCNIAIAIPQDHEGAPYPSI